MPFIRGRYHMNPIAGQALEAAREAEAARLAAVDQQLESDGQGGNDGIDDNIGNQAAINDGRGPIHRVEIEAAEMVPSHSGRAERGFVAHIHRLASGHPAGLAHRAEFPGNVHAARAETHVFSGHQDLVDFLHHEFAKDSAGR